MSDTYFIEIITVEDEKAAVTVDGESDELYYMSFDEAVQLYTYYEKASTEEGYKVIRLYKMLKGGARQLIKETSDNIILFRG